MLQRTSAISANLSFQLVLDSRVALGQGRAAGPAAGPGRAAHPEQGAVLLQWQACPWHRAGGQASWDKELSQAHAQPWQQGGQKHENTHVVSSWQIAENSFWEVKGLRWFPLCF